MVVITPTAAEDLERLIRTHSLPPTTRDRLKRSIGPLQAFPSLGAPLAGRWADFRFVLGPWRWMIVVYAFDEAADRVAIVTIQDAPSGRAASSSPG